MSIVYKLVLSCVLTLAVWAAPRPAVAEQITVTHWGVLMYGAPYAIAIEKGYYKEAGLDIDGVLTSKGGGTTMRNVMASSLPYGEVALSAALAAMNERAFDQEEPELRRPPEFREGVGQDVEGQLRRQPVRPERELGALEGPVGLPERLGERPPDRHDLSDAAHRRRKLAISVRELLERPPGILTAT